VSLEPRKAAPPTRRHPRLLILVRGGASSSPLRVEGEVQTRDQLVSPERRNQARQRTPHRALVGDLEMPSSACTGVDTRGSGRTGRCDQPASRWLGRASRGGLRGVRAPFLFRSDHGNKGNNLEGQYYGALLNITQIDVVGFGRVPIGQLDLFDFVIAHNKNNSRHRFQVFIKRRHHRRPSVRKPLIDRHPAPSAPAVSPTQTRSSAVVPCFRLTPLIRAPRRTQNLCSLPATVRCPTASPAANPPTDQARETVSDSHPRGSPK
jgi:hypothetical protein